MELINFEVCFGMSTVIALTHPNAGRQEPVTESFREIVDGRAALRHQKGCN